MKNKKGWMRIIEAFIAVLIITGGVLVVLSKQNNLNSNSSEKIYEKQRYILDIVTNNESLRKAVIENQPNVVSDAILQMLPANFDFTIKICEISDICNTDTPHDREVYTSEVIVTSTIQQYQPRKLRFFVWVKG
ncbi:Uncharacterised protein [uncultured archaeon]|nr:Uncharacterised protein [uncultured archaeon]